MSEITGESAVPDPPTAGAPAPVLPPLDQSAAELWQPVAAGKLAAVLRIRSALLPVLAVGAAVPLGMAHQPAVAIAVAAAGVLLYGALWIMYGRRARSWRYRERADDLLIDHGLLFRKQVVVPYGRMQFVDVKVDPLDRLLGIATVQLHTAAAATDARIPGLVPEQAQQLRDRLAELGQARMSGL